MRYYPYFICCKECNVGWIYDPDHGCLEINECSTLDPCKKNEFCINNEGSFTCLGKCKFLIGFYITGSVHKIIKYL